MHNRHINTNIYSVQQVESMIQSAQQLHLQTDALNQRLDEIRAYSIEANFLVLTPKEVKKRFYENIKVLESLGVDRLRMTQGHYFNKLTTMFEELYDYAAFESNIKMDEFLEIMKLPFIDVLRLHAPQFSPLQYAIQHGCRESKFSIKVLLEEFLKIELPSIWLKPFTDLPNDTRITVSQYPEIFYWSSEDRKRAKNNECLQAIVNLFYEIELSQELYGIIQFSSLVTMILPYCKQQDNNFAILLQAMSVAFKRPYYPAKETLQTLIEMMFMCNQFNINRNAYESLTQQSQHTSIIDNLDLEALSLFLNTLSVKIPYHPNIIYLQAIIKNCNRQQLITIPLSSASEEEVKSPLISKPTLSQQKCSMNEEMYSPFAKYLNLINQNLILTTSLPNAVANIVIDYIRDEVYFTAMALELSSTRYYTQFRATLFAQEKRLDADHQMVHDDARIAPTSNLCCNIF